MLFCRVTLILRHAKAIFTWERYRLFRAERDVGAQHVDAGVLAEVAGAAGGVGEADLLGVGFGDGVFDFILAGT